MGLSKNFKAYNLLLKRKLWEPSQSIGRIIIETMINYGTFVKLFTEDIYDVTKKFSDCLILEANKKHRLCGMKDFVENMSQPDGEWENVQETQLMMAFWEERMKNKYSKKEWENIKNNGFTGRNIEQRAALIGHTRLYQHFYRSFSKNVHSNDFMENVITLKGSYRNDFTLARNLANLSEVSETAVYVLFTVNSNFNLGLEESIEKFYTESSKWRPKGSSLGEVDKSKLPT